MKKVGLFTCVTIIVGGMIGSAIFSLSGSTMVNAGPASMLSWLIAAAVMLIYGLVCTELSTRFPRSGGVYVFPAKALDAKGHGRFWGWVSTWGFLNGNIVSIAFAAMCLGQTVGGMFGLSAKAQTLVAVGSVAFCLILNCINFSLAGKMNSVLTGGLICAILLFVGTCFLSGDWEASNLVPFFTQGEKGTLGFLAAVPTAMVGYGSIVAMAFLVSEVDNPSRTIPKAVLIAMAIVVVIYTSIIAATMGFTTATSLDETGMSFQALSAASAKLPRFGYLNTVVGIATSLALITTMSIVLTITVNLMQASAEDGMLPKSLCRTCSNGSSPVMASIVAVASAAVACFPSFIWTIINLGVLFSTVTVVINIFSLYAARRMPDPAGAELFRMPMARVLPAIALVVIVVCYIPDIITGGWLVWVYSAVWYLVGIVWFWLYAKRKSVG